MSINLSKLNEILLLKYFGENVRLVGECLFSAVQSRTLGMIMKYTGLSKNDVSQALAILIKFRLVKFSQADGSTLVEYTIQPDKVYLLVRYPKYIQYIQNKCGPAAGLLVNELLHVGSETASNLIIRCTETEIGHNKLTALRDEFLNLIKLKYVMRAPAVLETTTVGFVPTFNIDEHNFFTEPDIDIQSLIRLKNREITESSDREIFWLVNIDRLHQEFRDLIMIDAMERTIDKNAAECMTLILNQMYARTNAWQASTNPISLAEIRHNMEKSGAHKANAVLYKQLDQYISVICDDRLKCLSKFGESSGGQYVVHMKHAIEELTLACIENIIMEKFGKKAARIFKIVRLQKYCDQDDIQREAMIPAKEAKLFTYKLLEESFLQLKTIRKSGAGGNGMAKSFCLFYINQTQIVSMIIETCYKSMFNVITRGGHIKAENARIIDKSQRLELIVRAMRERGQPEEYINEIFETITPPEKELLQIINIRCKNLVNAEIGLDETILLLQLYQYYQSLK